MRALRARPAESEQKLSYVALADLVDEAFDEVGIGPSSSPTALRSPTLRSGTAPATEPPRGRQQPLSSLCSQRAPRRARCWSLSTTYSGSISASAPDAGLRVAPPATESRRAARTPGGGRTVPAAGASSERCPRAQLLRIAPVRSRWPRSITLVKSRPRHVSSRDLFSRAWPTPPEVIPSMQSQMARALVPRGDLKAGTTFARPPQPRGAGGLAGRNFVGARTAARARRGRHVAADPVDPCVGPSYRCRLRRRASGGGGGGGGADLWRLAGIRFGHPLLASVIYGSASAERLRACSLVLCSLG